MRLKLAWLSVCEEHFDRHPLIRFRRLRVNSYTINKFICHGLEGVVFVQCSLLHTFSLKYLFLVSHYCLLKQNEEPVSAVGSTGASEQALPR